MLFNWYVKPLSCYVSKVLPATYDATLSYYECLAKLTYKLNETIKNLNDLEENLPTYVKQAIDAALGGWEEKMQQQFAEQNAKLQAMQEQIDAQDKHIDQKLGEFKAELDAAIREMEAVVNQQLSAMWAILTSGLASNRAYTDAQIAKLRSEFPDLSNVFVISPVDGRLVPIQVALDDMYDVLRYGALTAGQYGALQLTAKEYDDKNLTAFRYDMYGLVELWPYLNPHKMHSVTTGELIIIGPAVYQLADYVRENGITAQAYDNLQLTAEGYDAKQVTSYNYDWAGVTA